MDVDEPVTVVAAANCRPQKPKWVTNVAEAAVGVQSFNDPHPKCTERRITGKWCEIRQTFVLNVKSKPWLGFPNPALFGRCVNVGGRNASPLR